MLLLKMTNGFDMNKHNIQGNKSIYLDITLDRVNVFDSVNVFDFVNVFDYANVLDSVNVFDSVKALDCVNVLVQRLTITLHAYVYPDFNV